MLEDVDDLLGDGLTGGEGAEDGSKPVSGETERGHRAGGGGGVGSGGAAAGELPVRSPFRRYPHREPRSLHGGGHMCIT